MEGCHKFRQNIAICCLLLLATTGCADSWLLYPSKQPIDAGIARRMFFAYNDRKVELFVAQSPGVIPGTQPEAYSLEFTGNSTRAEQVAGDSAKMWGQRPVEVWVMNYPGFGKSDGPTKLGSIPPASLAAYDLLAKTSNGKPIFLKGYSMGTTAALCVAARRPCAGIILQSPPPLQQEIMQAYGWWNLWVLASVTAMEVPQELNSLTNAPKVHVPAVFIISGKDRLVPPQYQMMVVNSYPGDKKCLVRKNASHSLPISPDNPALQEDVEWLWKKSMEEVQSAKCRVQNEDRRSAVSLFIRHFALCTSPPPEHSPNL
jgi:alpha/beta superfamily hydrolase